MNRLNLICVLGLTTIGCSDSTRPVDDAGIEDTSVRPTQTLGDGSPRTQDGTPPVSAREDLTRCPPRNQWPQGMACVEGGRFPLGFAGGQPDEGQPGEVVLSPFFMDLYEITNEEYAQCVEERRCKRTMPYRRFGGPRQPIVAVSWFDARAYCEMVGKRLPTEAEWERAASGPDHRQYPWGNEPAGCEKAQITDSRGHGCGDDVTLPVGSKAPGFYGLFDMAGNVHEWVADWYSPCLRGCDGECGDECFGMDPRGPCGGAEECEGRTKRSIRGGSWYWPAERARATARRGADPRNEENHRFGFRCAKSLSTETASGAVKTQVPSTGERLPLTPKQRRMLDEIPSEELALPDEHYFHTNEWRHDLLTEHLAGLGGAYIGVGADQNYTMASLAGSELLLLVDFDPRIPRLHRILEILVLASPTPDELLGRFTEDAAEDTIALLRRELGDHAEAEAIANQFRRHRERWGEYLGRVRRIERNGVAFGWLAEPSRYAEVRRLFSEGRIIARAGDVTGSRTLRAMGQALRRLDMPAQVVYFSNAEQFFPYSESFVENIRSLPTSKRSVVVRTTRHPRLRNADGCSWHYIVHDLDDFRERLETGAYPRASALLSDLLVAGDGFLGRNGLSKLTAQVPRRQAERDD